MNTVSSSRRTGLEFGFSGPQILGADHSSPPPDSRITSFDYKFPHFYLHAKVFLQ